MVDSFFEELSAATSLIEKAAIVAEYTINELPEGIALITRQCIVLHWFDKDVISVLNSDGSEETADTIFEELTSLPFIEETEWGFTYHEATREGLLAKYCESHPDLLTRAASLAAQSFKNA